jgi:hypothetical protein
VFCLKCIDQQGTQAIAIYTHGCAYFGNTAGYLEKVWYKITSKEKNIYFFIGLLRASCSM